MSKKYKKQKNPEIAKIPEIWNEKYLNHDKKFPGYVNNDVKTREIDLYIHYNPHSFDRSLNTNEKHIEHQKKIIKLIKGNEIAVLNDKKVKYPYKRTYFEGKTGTMSNILNSCFFILYKHGLELNVDINIEDDICIIFMLLESINLKEMSKEEKNSLNYIIKKLKIKKSNHFLFDEIKWEQLITYFKTKYNDTLKTSEIYKISKDLPINIKDFEPVIDITQDSKYRQYEYGPEYLKKNVITNNNLRINKFIKIKDIFLDTEKNELNTNKSICQLLFLYDTMSGGFNKNIIKRKKTNKHRRLKISNKKK